MDPIVSLNGNHPVLIALEGELAELRRVYAAHPTEVSRYRLARLESLIRQWAPGWQPERSSAA
ncbi:MAG: hypothetical protein ACKO7Z_00470 [Cyanobacteriota bacterium]